jgi:hypothetical protein
MKMPEDMAEKSIFLDRPKYISPIFRDDLIPGKTKADPLTERSERRPYIEQTVLVFQISQDMPPSIWQLYQGSLGSEGRKFLSLDEIQLIPWDTLHTLECFVSASIFFGHAMYDPQDLNQMKTHLAESCIAHTPYKRSHKRPHRGKASSIGERADQRGHIG